MKTYDWLIVGGGIAGISLSEILTREGHSVALIENPPMQPCPPEKATCEHVFGFEYGNCGFLKAKKNGGINSVSHVDIEVSNYLVYGMRETRVYGD